MDPALTKVTGSTHSIIQFFNQAGGHYHGTKCVTERGTICFINLCGKEKEKNNLYLVIQDDSCGFCLAALLTQNASLLRKITNLQIYRWEP